jgi:hypothetical protein
MPIVPHGRWEGAEAYRVNLSREDDDYQVFGPNERIKVLRISIGGTDEIGYYLKFRGDPDDVVKVLEIMLEAARRQLPRGRYRDERTHRHER